MGNLHICKDTINAGWYSCRRIGPPYTAIQGSFFWGRPSLFLLYKATHHILHILRQYCFVFKLGTNFARLVQAYHPLKTLVHCKMINETKMAGKSAEIPHQARMEKYFAFKTTAVCLLSSQTLTNCCLKKRWCNTEVNMPLSQLFLKYVAGIKLKLSR